MVLPIERIKQSVEPVAQKYRLKAVYLFGSYARNEATDKSDIDLLVDRTGSTIKGLFDMSALYSDLRESLGRDIDLITTQTLEQSSTRARMPLLVDNLNKERVQIYGQ